MLNFTSILVANRGEIACRVIRTARQLGYRTIAVYSDVDAAAPHVQLADESVLIGPGPVTESYLVPDLILKAAEASGAQSIHPGYGFLSENAEFAEAVERAGLIFIGPTPAAIRVMGNKAESKRRMIDAGVPCIPGYEGLDQSNKTLLDEGSKLDLPIMVKAAAGGGGRGMRLVSELSELSNAIKLARAEAEGAFGSGELILETAIIKPRHVEIQVFADSKGNTIHLGERDCSVQRRHQKVVEEAPCPIMTAELREKMGQAAIDAAKSVNYRGAGTVEFLLDENNFFYFLEMNTRLQVEHPVTELITGQDLVALQLRVAQGEDLQLGQKDLKLDGHAIEVRLYTEDPSQDFMPASGPVHLWAPAVGDGIRIDDGIVTGQSISPFYDPMVAKIIGYGDTRESARLKLLIALKKTVLFGTPSNKDFLISCLERQSFIDGDATTAFISEEFSDEDMAVKPPTFLDSAVAACIDLVREHQSHSKTALSVSEKLRNWTNASPLLSRKQYHFDDLIYDFSISPVEKNADEFCVSDIATGQCSIIKISNTSDIEAQVMVDGDKHIATYLSLNRGELYCSIEGRGNFFKDMIIMDGAAQETEGGGCVLSPMHGMLLEVLVKAGDSVSKGQTLAVLEAMKMHYEIQAEIDGTVIDVSAGMGDQVASDQLLFELKPDEV
jgi:geranyl-CoA carboxylase alpha subunit